MIMLVLIFTLVVEYVCMCLVVSDSATMDRIIRLLCPWGSPGKNTGAGCHFLLQGIFLTQGWNPHLLCLLNQQVDSLPLNHLGSLLLIASPSLISYSNLMYLYMLNIMVITQCQKGVLKFPTVYFPSDLKTAFDFGIVIFFKKNHINVDTL